MKLRIDYISIFDRNLRREYYPADLRIVFDNVVRDTSTRIGIQNPARPAKFRVFADLPSGERQLDFAFRDLNNDGTIGPDNDPNNEERIDILIPLRGVVGTSPDSLITWRVRMDSLGTLPKLGDVWRLKLKTPLADGDAFSFTTRAQRIDGSIAKASFEPPYVVPNPYIEAAGFEPARFNVTGRGDRRIEFRAIAAGSTIRIYTVRGDLVQTLRHDGSDAGFIAWNLRSKDNLDVAPGLYVFHVEAPGIGTSTGKFAIVK